MSFGSAQLSLAAFPHYHGFLTDEHQDEQERGHARRDVEHHLNVTGQLIHVFYIRNQDRWNQKANGDPKL